MRIVSHVLRFSLTDLSKQTIRRFRLFASIAFVSIIAGAAIISASSDRFRKLIEVSEASGGKLPSSRLSPAHVRVDVGMLASDAQMNQARSGHTATLLANGKVLIAGGENSSGFVTPAEVFDPTNGVFSYSGSLSLPRADHTATRLADGRVLIAGGRGLLGPTNLIEIFDFTLGVFTPGPNLNSARSGHSATVLSDGRIVFAGGDAAGSVEIYD